MSYLTQKTIKNNVSFSGIALHSGLSVNCEQYKYLVQGEYVEFNIEKMKVDTHENQATNIKGIFSGALMCETRFNNKDMSKNRDGFTQIKKKTYNKTH